MTHVPEKPELDDKALDNAFAELRLEEASLPDALSARLLADAARLQPQRPAVADHIQDFFDNLSALLGGWRGGVALAASTVMGVSLGYAAPDTFSPGYTEFEISAEAGETDGNLLDALFPESDA